MFNTQLICCFKNIVNWLYSYMAQHVIQISHSRHSHVIRVIHTSFTSTRTGKRIYKSMVHTATDNVKHAYDAHMFPWNAEHSYANIGVSMGIIINVRLHYSIYNTDSAKYI